MSGPSAHQPLCKGNEEYGINLPPQLEMKCQSTMSSRRRLFSGSAIPRRMAGQTWWKTNVGGGELRMGNGQVAQDEFRSSVSFSDGRHDSTMRQLHERRVRDCFETSGKSRTGAGIVERGPPNTGTGTERASVWS